MSTQGVIIAAPSSGSGKTLISLGLMAALRQRNAKVAPAKVGPDYIDPAFHHAALGRGGANLDGWAMDAATLSGRIARLAADADLIICEGVMGLLDGADVPTGANDGSTAAIAAATGWPVVLVVDAARMAGTAAAIVHGLAHIRPDIAVTGVIFNRVASDRHRRMIARAMHVYCPNIAVLGFVPPLPQLAVPSRHLGLVQAAEHPHLTAFIAAAAGAVNQHVDVDAVLALARPASLACGTPRLLPPLGQRIAVAQDVAFAFAFADTLADWRQQGAEILPFSPLDDQPPASDADAVFLPGGYPELAAPQLSANGTFAHGMRHAAQCQIPIHGECGGYMVLGQTLIDADGTAHAMLGLLPVVTSMANPKRHLGYRRARLAASRPWGQQNLMFRAHEFHYAVEEQRQGQDLLHTAPAHEDCWTGAGCWSGSVSGSFVHLIALE